MSKHKPRAATRFDKIVGGYIRAVRQSAKVSQTDLADNVGVTFQQIQKYEKGTNRITVERFAKICDHLNQCPAKALQLVLARSASGADYA